jgi:hypothetical protein
LLGFVFQFHFLRPEASALPCRALLVSLGFAAHAHKRPDQLSGGRRQRVAVVGALANDPQDQTYLDRDDGAVGGNGNLQAEGLRGAVRSPRVTLGRPESPVIRARGEPVERNRSGACCGWVRSSSPSVWC